MKVKVLFFTEEYYIDCHVGSSYFGHGIYVENSNFLIFFNKTTKNIRINSSIEVINIVKKLFNQSEIIAGNPEIEEKVTIKTVSIQELEKNDLLFNLIQELKELVEKEESVKKELMKYFPKDEKKKKEG